MRLEKFQPHVALGLYLVLLSLVLSSLVLASGLTYLHYVLLYLGALITGYAVIWRFFPSLNWHPSDDNPLESIRNRVVWALLAISSVFVVAHFVKLGHVPVVEALFESDYFTVMLIRQDIFRPDTPAVWRYLPNILVKSAFPFLALFFLRRSRLGLIVTLAVGSCYAVALMNKLFIVLLIVPAFAYAVLTRRWVSAALLPVIPGFGLALLIQIQNPHLQPQSFVDTVERIKTLTGATGMSEGRRAELKKNYMPDDEDTRPPVVVRSAVTSSGATLVGDTLYRRVILVPGSVISAWFSNIPGRLPHAHGCGYRWLAPFLGCEYKSYAALVNSLENPELASTGVRGTMTAASFVEDYANFGLPGLVCSGVLLAALLVLIGRLFRQDWRANLALNAIPLILLLELPLSTVILTGGWIVTLVLALLILERNDIAESGK